MCLSNTGFFLYRVNGLAGKVAVTDIVHLDLRRGAGKGMKGSELNGHKTDAQRAICSRV